MVIEKKRDETSDHTAHVEYTPEQRNIRALPVGRRVGGHNGPLRHPEKSGADTQKGSGGDGERLVFVVVVVEKRAGIEAVSAASGEKGNFRT